MNKENWAVYEIYNNEQYLITCFNTEEKAQKYKEKLKITGRFSFIKKSEFGKKF